VKAGKEKASGSGFGGKGLERLDQERDLARRRERKQYGEEGGEEVADEAPETTEDTMVVKAASTSIPKVPAPGPSLDDKIVVHKRSAADALDRVKQAASAVDNRLKKNGELRSGVPIDNKGPDAGAYHATLEINDFPRAYLHICYSF
jgi:ATP-dependent RNA helicase DDX46/PRP5